MASSVPSQTTKTVELNKENSIDLMSKLVHKGQDAGHYSLSDSFLIYQALCFLGYDESKENVRPKPKLTENRALDILAQAILVSQKLGHCYSFEDSSNAFQVVAYISENFLKEDVPEKPVETSEDPIEPPVQSSSSNIPLKKRLTSLPLVGNHH